MECNKEDAIKAKELAEKKILEKDLVGAKQFAVKARDLYPNLDGLPQLLAMLEVYVSAERRINGEVDWYRVLGVEPLADDETIRRRYRKLALTLHPDKNKLVGADGAFKLISQAWTLLSDKAQRTFYDQSRNSRGIYGETPHGKPSAPASQNGFFNFFNTANWKDRDPRSAAHPNPTPVPPVTSKQTFWTMCGSCRTQFEYHTAYLNCNLVCPQCRKLFLAFETPPPSIYKNASSTSRISQMLREKSNLNQMERNLHVSGRMRPPSSVNSNENIYGSGPFFMPGGFSSVPTSASFSAKASNQVSSEHLKRGREDTAPPVMMEEAHLGKTHPFKTTSAGSAFQSSCFGSNSVLKRDRPREKRHVGEFRVDSDRREMEAVKASQNEGIRLGDESGSQRGNVETGRVNPAGNYKRNGMRDIPQLQIRNMLMDMARKDIRKKLNEVKVASVSRNSDKARDTCKEVKEKDKERTRNGVKSGAEELQKLVESETMGKNSSSTDADILASEAIDSLSMSVPDPDFHDFDNDRTEKAFGANQVWAVYDDDDGMPRYYALIHNVISVKPLKMKISWLNSKSNDELAPIKWVGSGFPKTCGDFRIGKHEFNGSLNSFSHRVKWKKGLRGVVHICPKKGEVWALYRNWSLDWNELTPDEIIHEYDMVEVLEDYNEEQGVNVAPLVKVAGFKTVFCQHADPRKIRNIPRAEMFRLSHQIPSYLLTGQEGHNAPRGCLELDPAATPMELLQVVAEAPKQETKMTMEKSLEDRLWHKQKSGENEVVETFQTTKEKDSVEDISRKGVAEAMKKKESRLENLIVYKRKRVREKREL